MFLDLEEAGRSERRALHLLLPFEYRPLRDNYPVSAEFEGGSSD